MRIEQLSEIVGDVLGINPNPINRKSAWIELSMGELLLIVEKAIKQQP